MLPDKSINTAINEVNEVVIACDPRAIPAEQRDQWIANGKQVYAAVQESRELPDGYMFRLLPDSAMLVRVAEYISNERLCCPFLRFTLEVEPNQGSFWLRLTGGDGVKAYIGGIFAESGLINERVAKAAGLR